MLQYILTNLVSERDNYSNFFLLYIHIDYLLQGNDRMTTVIDPPVMKMKMRKIILLKRRTKQVVIYINLLLERHFFMRNYCVITCHVSASYLGKKVSKLSAVQMLSDKYERKAELKQKELEIRKMELDLQKRKFEVRESKENAFQDGNGRKKDDA